MNWFSGRFVVCVALLMVVSASSFAGDRCCRRVSKTCERSREARCCQNLNVTDISTDAACAPATTCCQPVATCCVPTNAPIAPLPDDLRKSLSNIPSFEVRGSYLGDHGPHLREIANRS